MATQSQKVCFPAHLGLSLILNPSLLGTPHDPDHCL